MKNEVYFLYGIEDPLVIDGYTTYRPPKKENYLEKLLGIGNKISIASEKITSNTNSRINTRVSTHREQTDTIYGRIAEPYLQVHLESQDDESLRNAVHTLIDEVGQMSVVLTVHDYEGKLGSKMKKIFDEKGYSLTDRGGDYRTNSYIVNAKTTEESGKKEASS